MHDGRQSPTDRSSFINSGVANNLSDQMNLSALDNSTQMAGLIAMTQKLKQENAELSYLVETLQVRDSRLDKVDQM